MRNGYIIHHTGDSAHRSKGCIVAKVNVNTQQLGFGSQIKEAMSNFSSCNPAHLKPCLKSISKTYYRNSLNCSHTGGICKTALMSFTKEILKGPKLPIL